MIMTNLYISLMYLDSSFSMTPMATFKTGGFWHIKFYRYVFLLKISVLSKGNPSSVRSPDNLVSPLEH